MKKPGGKKFDEKISDNSVWITATPTSLAKALPFYIIETGRFTAQKDYIVERETHDSFLLLYTVNGRGFLQTGETELTLGGNDAVIIDCHLPHRYGSITDEWEFLWLHFGGICADTMFDIIYPSNAVCAVQINDPFGFERRMTGLGEKAENNNITGHTDISLDIHSVINTVCSSALERISESPGNDIRLSIDFIKNNYSEQITIDDMIRDMPVSKYHFIRLFRRVMGNTPYRYLTNYRINMSKTLLRSTDKSVAEIAEMCGFLDTSNFIAHFKRHTGQKPLAYRRDFMQPKVYPGTDNI
ncbi:MAG: helix-turn-helix transcriptional regulator [Oscillospiraceae bacterium]|nr:helix-turn-helix transcriptional regulator [Oscillospiraceae bacterium]